MSRALLEEPVEADGANTNQPVCQALQKLIWKGDSNCEYLHLSWPLSLDKDCSSKD